MTSFTTTFAISFAFSVATSCSALKAWRQIQKLPLIFLCASQHTMFVVIAVEHIRGFCVCFLELRRGSLQKLFTMRKIITFFHALLFSDVSLTRSESR